MWSTGHSPKEGTIGRVAFHVPKLGYFMVWFHSRFGLLLLIVLPTLILGVSELWRLWRPRGKHEPERPSVECSQRRILARRRRGNGDGGSPMKRWPRRRLLVPVTIGLVLGLSGGALAAFAATTTDGPNRFIAAADWEPPHVTRTVVAKTVGYLAGTIRQGGQFYVYAQIDDSGNPPAGVGVVTVDVSAFSTGGTAVAMVAGAFSAQGVPYNYRSVARTATNSDGERHARPTPSR